MYHIPVTLRFSILPPPFPFSPQTGNIIKHAKCSVVSNSVTRDCSLPGFSVHGTLQARILEWVIVSSSRASSQHRG